MTNATRIFTNKSKLNPKENPTRQIKPLLDWVTKLIMLNKPEPKQNVTPFVKRMREIAALSKPVQLWDSLRLGTYRRGKNNAL